ncbi:MAG: hypothetical protein V3U76_01520 [Granulosicoccus sp.]
MPDDTAHAPDASARFYSNYLICLAKASVREEIRQHYVRHIEWFIKAQKGRRIRRYALRISALILQR